MSDNLKYPIGKFSWPSEVSAEGRHAYIARIAATPARLRAAVEGLNAEQFDTPYREGGWTVRQVVHHVPDSHLQSYVRFKLALTEDTPTIKAYDEAAGARLSDTAHTPPETSLCLLQCLHERWIHLLNGMSEGAWKKTFLHPALGPVALEKNVALYAWHGDHHVEHIMALRRRMNW